MKMRHLAVATSAALISLGALAAGERHSQSRESTAPQASEAAIVTQAQQRLRDAGYAATPQGLREFQQANAIEPSGKLDAQTLAALGVETSGARETPKY